MALLEKCFGQPDSHEFVAPFVFDGAKGGVVMRVLIAVDFGLFGEAQVEMM